MNNNIQGVTNDKKRFVIGICVSVVILVVLAVCCGLIYKKNIKDKESSQSKQYKNVTVEFIDKDGRLNSFKIKTKENYLRGVLNEIEELKIEGEESSTGLYVKTINNVTADYAINKSYWAFYVNDEYSQTGIDTQVVTNGDKFRIEYTSCDEE